MDYLQVGLGGIKGAGKFAKVEAADNRRANLRVYTPKENANNRETSRHIIAFGESKTIAEWADDPRCGCAYNILRKRLDKELMPEIAILAEAGGQL